MHPIVTSSSESTRTNYGTHDETPVDQLLKNFPSHRHSDIRKILQGLSYEKEQLICQIVEPHLMRKYSESKISYKYADHNIGLVEETKEILTNLVEMPDSLFAAFAPLMENSSSHLTLLRAIVKNPGLKAPREETIPFIKKLKCFSDRLDMLHEILKIPEVERNAVFKAAASFIEMNLNFSEPAEILRTIWEMPERDREAICFAAFPLIKKLPKYSGNQAKILKAIAEIPAENLDAVCRATLQLIENFDSYDCQYYYMELLTCLKDAPKEQLDSVCNMAPQFFAGSKCASERLNIIKFIINISKEDLTKISIMARHFNKMSELSVLKILKDIVEATSTPFDTLLELAKPWLANITKLKEQVRIVKAIAETPEKYRHTHMRAVEHWASELTGVYQKTNLLEIVSEVPLKKLATVIKITESLGVSPEERISLLREVAAIREDQREEVLESARPWLEGCSPATWIHEVAKIIPGERQEICQLARPLLVEIRDRYSFSSAIRNVLEAIMKIAKNQRIEVCKAVEPLIENWMTDDERIDLLKTVESILEGKREAVCITAKPYLQGLKKEDRCARLCLIAEIGEERYRSLLKSTNSLPIEYYYKTTLLRALAKIPAGEEDEVIAIAKPFLGNDSWKNIHLLETIGKIAKDDRAPVVALAKPWLDNDGSYLLWTISTIQKDRRYTLIEASKSYLDQYPRIPCQGPSLQSYYQGQILQAMAKIPESEYKTISALIKPLTDRLTEKRFAVFEKLAELPKEVWETICKRAAGLVGGLTSGPEVADLLESLSKLTNEQLEHIFKLTESLLGTCDLKLLRYILANIAPLQLEEILKASASLIKSFQDSSSQIYVLHHHIAKIKPEELETFCEAATPLCKGLSFSLYCRLVPDLLTTLAEINPELRVSSAKAAQPFIERFDYEGHRGHVLKAIANIPEDQHEPVFKIIKLKANEFKNGYDLANALEVTAGIDPEKRELLTKSAWPLFSELRNSSLTRLLKVMAKLPEEEHALLSEIAMTVCKGEQHRYDTDMVSDFLEIIEDDLQHQTQVLKTLTKSNDHLLNMIKLVPAEQRTSDVIARCIEFSFDKTKENTLKLLPNDKAKLDLNYILTPPCPVSLEYVSALVELKQAKIPLGIALEGTWLEQISESDEMIETVFERAVERGTSPNVPELIELCRYCRSPDLKHILEEDLRLNQSIPLTKKALQNIWNERPRNPQHLVQYHLALQTHESYEEVIEAFQDPDLDPITENSTTQEKRNYLLQAVVLRKREGLLLAGHIIKRWKDENTELLLLSLRLCIKVEVVPNKNTASHLFDILESNLPRDINLLAAKALSYQPDAAKLLGLIAKTNDSEVQSALIDSLSLCQLDELSEKVFKTLTGINSTDRALQKSIAKALSTLKNETALKKAAEIIMGPWYENTHTNHFVITNKEFKTYQYRPHFYDTRFQMKKIIGERLVELKREQYERQALLDLDDYAKNPEKMPERIKKVKEFLLNLPDRFRYLPLQMALPKGKFVFRGIMDIKGVPLAEEAFNDLLLKGPGSSDLSLYQYDHEYRSPFSEQGMWAKVSQIFMGTKIHREYDKNFITMAIPSEEINEMNLRQNIRWESEQKILNCASYSCIRQHQISKIFASIDRKEDLSSASFKAGKSPHSNYKIRKIIGRELSVSRGINQPILRDRIKWFDPEQSYEEQMKKLIEEEGIQAATTDEIVHENMVRQWIREKLFEEESDPLLKACLEASVMDIELTKIRGDFKKSSSSWW